MTAVKRTTAALRQQDILVAGAEIAREHGFAGLTVRAVADRCGISESLIWKYYGGRVCLIDQVAAYGRRIQDADIVKEAIAWEK